jgi:hypothetical protein
MDCLAARRAAFYMDSHSSRIRVIDTIVGIDRLRRRIVISTFRGLNTLHMTTWTHQVHFQDLILKVFG